MLPCKFTSEHTGTILLCQRLPGQSIQEIIDQAIKDFGEMDADELVIRQPVYQNQNVAEPKLELKRFRGIPVKVLGSENFVYTLTENINILAENVASRFSLENLGALRDAELRHFAEEMEAVLPLVPEGLYKTPSGHFSRRFLRAGNAQSTQQVLDAFFFWLIPHLKDKNAILTDTWSISSLGLNACRRLVQYDHQSRDVDFHILPAPNPAKLGGDSIDQFVQTILDAQALFISSAKHSGDLVKKVETAFRGHPFVSGKIESVVLYNLGANEPATPELCDLQPSYAEDFARIQQPTSAKTLVEINPYSLFPSNYVDEVLEPLTKHSKGAMDFFSRFGVNSKFVEFHATNESSLRDRHSAYGIKTSELIHSEVFKSDFHKQLESIPGKKPEIVIFPPHEAGKELAEAVAQKINGIEKWGKLSLAALSNDEKEALEKSSSILVVDDAYISGQRLIRYQAELRELRYNGIIHYRIAIARPDNLQSWQQRKARLSTNIIDFRSSRKNTVDAVVELCLPNWPSELCPWCVEYQLYDRYQKQGCELPRLYKARCEALKSGDLTTSPFIFGLESTIGDGSIFCPKDSPPSVACMAVASTLQVMRCSNGEEPPLGLRRYPLATVFDHKTIFIPGHFSDPVLKAAILRNLNCIEFSPTKTSDEHEKGRSAIQMLKELEQNGQAEEIAREMCFAYHLGKLPNSISTELLKFVPEAEREFWRVVHSWRDNN